MNLWVTNIYTIQHGRIPDDPVIVTFLALPIMWGKNQPLASCHVYENTFENDSEYHNFTFCNHFP